MDLSGWVGVGLGGNCDLPHHVITLGSNKHNGDDAPGSCTGE